MPDGVGGVASRRVNGVQRPNHTSGVRGRSSARGRLSRMQQLVRKTRGRLSQPPPHPLFSSSPTLVHASTHLPIPATENLLVKCLTIIRDCHPLTRQTERTGSQFRIDMSEQAARAHTSMSNRAKSRQNADRKTVFRSVVDNPFRVQWPTVPLNIQNAMLACIVDMLSGVAEYNLSRERMSRSKRKRSTQSADASKKARRPSGDTAEPASPSALAEAPHTTPGEDIDDAVVNMPPILRSLAIGINEVTKRLEKLASSHRRVVKPNNDKNAETSVESGSEPSSSRVVIVCRADVDPPALIGHIPNLVATCNSRRQGGVLATPTWLISLPKGAEHTLAEALGLRRAAALLIEDSELCSPALEPMLQNIPLLAAPWLEFGARIPSATLVPTHIKQLRTTAPKDMKNAKEQRARGRAAAKERRKANIPSVPKRVTLTSKGEEVPPAA